tara:strand:- start:81 stop:269 length:189 start_codon:yes stop_codon:yes gene_type:complete
MRVEPVFDLHPSLAARGASLWGAPLAVIFLSDSLCALSRNRFSAFTASSLLATLPEFAKRAL